MSRIDVILFEFLMQLCFNSSQHFCFNEHYYYSCILYRLMGLRATLRLENVTSERPPRIVVVVCLFLFVCLFVTCAESVVLFSEERERNATQDSAVSQGFSLLQTANSRVAILSRSSEKRTPDHRLVSLLFVFELSRKNAFKKLIIRA